MILFWAELSRADEMCWSRQRACQKSMKSVSSHFAFQRLRTRGRATILEMGLLNIIDAALGRHLSTLSSSLMFCFTVYFLKCPQFLSLSGFDWVNKNNFPSPGWALFWDYAFWDSTFPHWDSNSFWIFLVLLEARLLGGDVAPFLDDWLLDLPRVALRPGAHLKEKKVKV